MWVGIVFDHTVHKKGKYSMSTDSDNTKWKKKRWNDPLLCSNLSL